jgi:8-oxo-dGTP pyrophosphatase MutT (NUDIX family)
MNQCFAPTPKEASTVILLRPAADDFEILMVKRHPNNPFVPDCYVFPGGAIEETDVAPELEDRCKGLDHPTAHQVLADTASPEIALAAWIAGIRETFEETGILLAYERSGKIISADTKTKEQMLAHYRSLLREGRISFKAFLEKEGFLFATDRLHYFSHWITPIGSPIRYDVRFFIAEMPLGQEALYDCRELTAHIWISPEKALSLHQRNQFDMVLPTVMTLRELCRFKTIEEILAFTKKKHVSPILTILKKINDRYVEVMPDGADYDPPC